MDELKNAALDFLKVAERRIPDLGEAGHIRVNRATVKRNLFDEVSYIVVGSFTLDSGLPTRIARANRNR